MGSRRVDVAIAGHERDLVQYFAMCGVWAVSTYTACDIRCSYCITYAQGSSQPRVPVDEVAGRLRRELAVVPPDGVIGVGSLVDAYPSVEAEVGATRAALAVLAEQQRRVVLVTKGPTVARDVDLLAAIPRLTVNVSLASTDDAVLAQIEPHAAPAAERLAAVAALADAGIDVQLHCQPWIPGMTDAEAMIAAAPSGVRVWFAPLAVSSPAVRDTALGRQFTQHAVDEAYRAEIERIGPRPRVFWQQPLWQTPDTWDAPYDAGDPRHQAPEVRNEATVRRLLAALEAGAGLQVWFDVSSPYLRCHDVRGVSVDPAHPDSGYFREVLFETAAAFDAPRYEVRRLHAAGDRVEATVVARGTHVRPLFGRAPTGTPAEVTAHLAYRFDGFGLVVELTQDVDLAPI